MASDEQRFRSGGDEPPFLAQETTLVETTSIRPKRIDQLSDLLDRARPGLGALAIPALVLVAGLVWFGGRSADEDDGQQTRNEVAGPSAVEPLIRGVSVGTGPIPDLPTGHLEPAFREPVPVDGFEAPAPPPTTRRATTRPQPTQPPTTEPPPTEPPPTEPPPTEPPPTEPPPTEPPPTEPPPEPSDQCQVRVGSTSLRDKPRRNGDVVAEVDGGTYPVVGFRAQWIQIDAGGTVGWIRVSAVNRIVGNCL